MGKKEVTTLCHAATYVMDNKNRIIVGAETSGLIGRQIVRKPLSSYDG